jgi:signal transduction histidine kinase
MMTREQALDLLKFGPTTERMEAAVVLRSRGGPEDLRSVRRALLRELDERVRAELVKTRTALEDLADERGPGELVGDDMTADETRADAYARAVQDTTYEIVHELRRLVGFARDSAIAEIESFEGSGTKADFDRLSELLNAVERLGDVASVPLAEEFDLGGLIQDLVALVGRGRLEPSARTGSAAAEAPELTLSEDRAPLIELLGRQTLLVVGDSGLVEIILRNGLLNAVEACATVTETSETPMSVLIDWGTTDVDTWVSISDTGPGIPTELVDPFKFASTTKRAHLGVGLTISQRAVHSLDGEILLTNRDSGGAFFSARWPNGGGAE